MSWVAVLLAMGTQPWSVPVLVVALSVVTLATALQLVPVPASLHRLLSPGAAALFDETLRPLGLYPAARPLSLDPPATGRELAKAVACLAAAAAAAHLSTTRERLYSLLGSVAVGGVAVAGAGMATALAGRGPLLEPRLTFVNPNHLAGFLNLASFIVLGFGLRAHGRTRLLWLMAFAVSGAGIFLSLSRGGIAAFFVGAAIFALLHVRRSRLDATDRRLLRYAAAPAAVATALAVAAYLALDPILGEMRTVRGATSEVKASLWPIALAIVGRFPIVGIGRGAFATVFPAYKVEPDPVTFTHLENEWLQASVDWGLPVGLLLVGAIAWTWLRAARSPDLSRPEMGALAGTAALAAQNTVDFSLELLGVAVPFAVVLGVLARSQPAWKVRPLVAWAASATALLLAVAGMGVWRFHDTRVNPDTVGRARTADEAVRRASAAVVWQPAYYLPQAAAGVRLVQEGRCVEALPWLTRAMKLNPTAPEPHRYAGRCLAASGADALARQEYRLAILMGDPTALGEAARRYPATDDLLSVVPDSPSGLRSLGTWLAPSRLADAERVLRKAWDDYRDAESLRLLADVVLAQGEAGPALELSRLYQQLRPVDPSGYLTGASALARMGREEEARRELEAGAARIPGSPQIVARLAEQALASRRYAEARRLAETIVASSPAELASKRLFVSRLLWAQGRTVEAIQEARAARDTFPTDPGPRLVLADYCAQVGRYDEAISALEGAAGLPGAKPGAYESRLSELRNARKSQQERIREQQILGVPGATIRPAP